MSEAQLEDFATKPKGKKLPAKKGTSMDADVGRQAAEELTFGPVPFAGRVVLIKALPALSAQYPATQIAAFQSDDDSCVFYACYPQEQGGYGAYGVFAEHAIQMAMEASWDRGAGGMSLHPITPAMYRRVKASLPMWPLDTRVYRVSTSIPPPVGGPVDEQAMMSMDAACMKLVVTEWEPEYRASHGRDRAIMEHVHVPIFVGWRCRNPIVLEEYMP